MMHSSNRILVVLSQRTFHTAVLTVAALCALLASAGCGESGSASTPPPPPTVVVNSLQDVAEPPAGTMTLRMALDQATSGEAITFDPALKGGVIELSIIGENRSTPLGEVYSGAPPTFQGYSERDYGKSALYARKYVVLDASALPAGITIEWTGGDGNPARVLAVYGNLTLRNVAIRGRNGDAGGLRRVRQQDCGRLCGHRPPPVSLGLAARGR